MLSLPNDLRKGFFKVICLNAYCGLFFIHLRNVFHVSGKKKRCGWMEKESHFYCWVKYSFKDADIYFNPKQD